MKLEGSCHVRWREHDSRQKKMVTRSASEDYYTIRSYIFGDGSSSVVLPIGTHRYPFSFTLPTGIPCSYQSKTGSVIHVCKVAIDVMKLFDVKHTEPFSVGAIYDLNRDPIAQNPVRFLKEKTICCLCCAGGEISFTMTLDHSGYVPGENIIIYAECTNNSTSSTDRTVAEVVQTVVYRAHGDTKSARNVICSVTHPGVGPGESDIWSGERLLLPPLPPSKLPHCNLISIDYKFKFSFVPSGMSFSLNDSTEIVIGAIPLRQTFASFTAPVNQAAQMIHTAPSPFVPLLGPEMGVGGGAAAAAPPPVPPHAAIGFVTPSAPPFQPPPSSADPPPAYNSLTFSSPPPYPWAGDYPELPPPSYQNCMQKNANESDGNEDSHASSSDNEDSSDEEGKRRTTGTGNRYTPLYVTYEWNTRP